MKKVMLCFTVMLIFLCSPFSSMTNCSTYPDLENGKEVLEIIVLSTKDLTGKKICIDPGHGGSDPGAEGYDGAGYPDEKDFTLNVSLRLRNLLEGDGATVVMTRETDKHVSLEERCNIAKENNSNVFVSIHCNSYSDENVSGTETYYWAENATNYSVGGKELANFIQAELVSHLGRSDRGIKGDKPTLGYHLYVLNHTYMYMNSSLAELVFISNKTEFELMCKASFKQDCAYALYHGICSYFSQTPKDYPPFVEITYPKNNSDIEGVIKITADVTDDFDVGWVRMKINDGSWLWDSTPPHEWLWDTRGVENGTYTIMVEANDSANLRTNKTVEVTVKNQYFKLRFTKGWNPITLPLNTTYKKAGDLASAIDNCTQVASWNYTSQSFTVYEKGSTSNNFSLEDGRGYFVYVNDSSNLTIRGTNISSTTIELKLGWNSLGWFNLSSIYAENLAQNITDCTAVAYWANTLGRFIVHPAGTTISNFEIRRGEGYLIYVEIPKAQATVALEVDQYNITITSISKLVNVTNATYQVMNASGILVTNGTVDEIYSLEVAGVMFTDRDADGYISPGDYFYVKNVTASGPGEPNGHFILGYLPAEKTIDNIVLKGIMCDVIFP